MHLVCLLIGMAGSFICHNLVAILVAILTAILIAILVTFFVSLLLLVPIAVAAMIWLIIVVSCRPIVLCPLSRGQPDFGILHSTYVSRKQPRDIPVVLVDRFIVVFVQHASKFEHIFS